MENGPFIDGLPIKHGDFPWLCLLNNQMVTIIYQRNAHPRRCHLPIPKVRGLGCLPFHDELAASLLRASLDQKDITRQAVIPCPGGW